MQLTPGLAIISIAALILSTPVQANKILDCSHGASLSHALDHAEEGDTIIFTGICSGPIVINHDDITLLGQGTAVIDGQLQNALIVRGAQNVKLANLEIRNGSIGILVDSQAHVTLENVVTHENGVFGMDIESTSAATLSGQITSEDNGVFGINVNNGSSLTLNHAQLIAQRNLLGIQLGTGANAFLADSTSSITVANNKSTGLTVVSGSHLVSFGGTISSHDNGLNGVSVNSKAGLDLDAASVLESFQNGGNGVQLAESSVMTLFNTTGFSGVPGDTTLKSHNNAKNGIAILTGSNLTLVNQVILESQNNSGAGVLADNGSSVTLLKANLSGNNPDVSLAFGTRSDIRHSALGTIACDPSVLSRGDLTCPAP